MRLVSVCVCVRLPESPLSSLPMVQFFTFLSAKRLEVRGKPKYGTCPLICNRRHKHQIAFTIVLHSCVVKTFTFISTGREQAPNSEMCQKVRCALFRVPHKSVNDCVCSEMSLTTHELASFPD